MPNSLFLCTAQSKSFSYSYATAELYSSTMQIPHFKQDR